MLHLTDGCCFHVLGIDIEGRQDIISAVRESTRLASVGILDRCQLAVEVEVEEESELMELELSSRRISTRYQDKAFLFSDSKRRGNKNIGALIKSLFYIQDMGED